MRRGTPSTGRTTRSTRNTAETTNKFKRNPRDSRTWRSSVLEAERLKMLPLKTIMIMFLTLVLIMVAMGVLYQNTNHTGASVVQEEQLNKTDVFEELYRKQNTSTNTGILQGG